MEPDENVECVNGKLIWRWQMTSEDRRRSDDRNWERFNDFMSKSESFRETTLLKLQSQIDATNALSVQVKLQNGRVTALEKVRDMNDTKIQDGKDSKTNTMNLVTISIAIVSAVTAIVMIFRK